MDSLFVDPNCSSFAPWASWLAQLDGLNLGVVAAELTDEGFQAQAAEALNGLNR